jgi:hypothetical protein
MTGIIIPLYLNTHWYFKIIFIYLDSLNLGLSSDIKIIRKVQEISDF